MSKAKRHRTLPFTQIITIVVATMAISMIVDFGRKAAANYRIRHEEIRLEQEIAAERAKHEALLARREYVQTDEYIEHVAREELKWMRQGETVVVPIPFRKPLPTPETTPALAKPLQGESHWQEWWALFFDRPPIEF